MSRRLFSIVTGVFAIALVSCSGNGEFTGYHELPGSGWPYGMECDYVVTSADSVRTAPLLLTITHDNSFEYSNLWLEVTYDDVLGYHHVDTVNVEMCDVYGNWYGKGLPGHYQLTDTLVAHGVALSDSSVVRLRHIMRVDTLCGISQVGIRF